VPYLTTADFVLVLLALSDIDVAACVRDMAARRPGKRRFSTRLRNGNG
jgi:hypothetical protein